MYKKYLFASGGYQGYEYAAKNNVSENMFAEYHNSIRKAAINIVGLEYGINSVLTEGAKRVAYDTRMPNAGLLSGSSYNNKRVDQLSTDFARMPFVAIRKEGNNIVLTGKPLNTDLYVNMKDPDQELLLKKLLPGYKNPSKYTAPQGYMQNAKPVIEFGAGGVLTSVINGDTLRKLIAVEFPQYLDKSVSESEEFTAVGTLPQGMSISFSIKVDGNSPKTKILGMPYSVANEGALPDNTVVLFSAEISPELYLPMDYAYWALYAETKEEFVPFMFMTHMNSLVRAASGATDDKKAANFAKELTGRAATAWKRANARKPTPLAMARRNREKEKLTGYKPKVATNADGYLITAANRIMRLPDTGGAMSEYQAAANEWFESLSNKDVENLQAGGKQAPKFRFPPTVLFVDHHNEVLVYTTQEGTVTSLNLRGARALDPITISKEYAYAVAGVISGHAFEWTTERKAKLGDEGRVVMEMLSLLFGNREPEIQKLAKIAALGAAMPPVNTNPIKVEFTDYEYRYYQTAVNIVFGAGSEKSVEARNLVTSINTSNDEGEYAENEIIKVLNRGMQAIAAVAKEVWSTGAKREDNGGVLNNAESDVEAYIVGMHTEKVSEYTEKRRTNERDNIVDALDRSKEVKVPNIDTSHMEFLFPHQAQFVQSVDIDSPPESAIIGAAPGGGKTNCIIIDINLLLGKGRIKRPVVVVPNNLVRQFVSEINEFTNGKVNAYPFTYQHVRDILMNPFGLNMSMAEVIKHLQELPPNTIIVTNYNTLRNEYTDSSLKASYEQVASYDNFGNAKPLKAYPFVDMLAAGGMDYVCGDESHKIKNKDSALAQAFLCLCAKAKYVRLSSGTTINNVVTDLVGQTQKINPAILGGGVEEFAEQFLGSKNAKQVSTSGQADNISSAIREYSLLMQKDSRSWDYMLPKMREIYHRVEMTPMQTRYYNVLFAKAVNRIQEDNKIKGDLEKANSGDDDAKTSNKIERVVKKHFSVIDRFVNDPTQFAEFEDGTFVYEEYKLLHDGNEAEPGSLDPAPVTADDLISVKARYAYNLLYAHMNEKGMLEVIREAAPRFTPDPQNKVIIVAPNRFVGNHVWDNMPPDLKRRAVRYRAGAFVQVEKFKTDDNIKFMVADEISISEGHNLQVGSRIIRMQQVWTPGGETQTLARIRRPDPKGKYNRDSLGYDIIVATKPGKQPTIDDLRIGRLLSKKFNNAMVEFGYEPSFRNEFFKGEVKPLPPIRMSMDVIKSFPVTTLELYFNQQQRFNSWFAKSSIDETRKVGREVEALTGKTLLDENGRPLSIKDFVAAVVIPTVEDSEIQGSSGTYVPWLPGVQPINPLGFDMQPVRSLAAPIVADDDEDEEEEDEKSKNTDEDEDEDSAIADNVEINNGDYVMTEFGPGIVKRPLRSGHKLEIFIPSLPAGRGEKYKIVRLPKTCVYVPLDDEGHKVLATAIKGKAGSKVPKPKPITQEQRNKANDRKNGKKEPEPDITDYENDDDFEDEDFELEGLLDEDSEDEDEDEIDTLLSEEEDGDIEQEEEDEELDEEEPEPTIEAGAFTVNGQLAIWADDTANGDALNTLYTRYGFHAFPDMARIEFKQRKALDIFLAKLAKAKFAIPRNLANEITTVAEGLTSRGRLHQVAPFNYSQVTNFLKTEQKRVPKRLSSSDPQTFRLYPLVTDGKFYLCASISKHPFNVVATMTKLVTGIPGASKVQKRDNMAVKFFENLSKAKTVAKKMIADGDLISDPESLLASFDDINNGHIEMPAIEKPVKPKPVVQPKPTPERPGQKPGKQPKVTKTGFEEETHNPLVEDVDEFIEFLRARRPTITLIKGSEPEGVTLDSPMRVKKFNLKQGWFALATDPTDTDLIEFDIPQRAKFNDQAGTMTTGGGRVWRLTYAG